MRDVVVFAVHNLNKDAPFTQLDLLVCRNLLIYLSAELQKNLHSRVSLRPQPRRPAVAGAQRKPHRLSGPVSAAGREVEALAAHRTPSSARPARQLSLFRWPGSMPSRAYRCCRFHELASSRKDGPFATLVQRVLLRQYTPPAVVINAKGEILYVNGRTGRYLEPAPGLSGMNIFDMAREELNYELSGAVHKASATRQDVVADNVKLHTETGRAAAAPHGEVPGRARAAGWPAAGGV